LFNPYTGFGAVSSPYFICRLEIWTRLLVHTKTCTEKTCAGFCNKKDTFETFMAEPCTSFDCTSLTFIYDVQQHLHASCTSNWNLPRFWPRPSGAARRAGRHHERHVGVAQQRTMRACVSSGMQEGAALLHPSLHKGVHVTRAVAKVGRAVANGSVRIERRAGGRRPPAPFLTEA
jgi:hypothetical protein